MCNVCMSVQLYSNKYKVLIYYIYTYAYIIYIYYKHTCFIVVHFDLQCTYLGTLLGTLRHI